MAELLRGISFGAGVQSTALLLMALEGDIEADFAIFADTQDEPAAVYKHLADMQARCAAAGFPLHVATAGRLSDEIRKPGTFISIPVFGRNLDGKAAQLRRQCSYQFKLRPMRAYVKANLLAKGQTWECLIGISTNEMHRAKPSGRKWVVNQFPLLLDKRMNRWQCEAYCNERGVFPPRSACTYCPYRTNDEWRALKPFEQPPEKAMRVNGFLPVTNIAGPDGRTLNLRNVIFVEGGQLVWFEEPNIFAVARFDGTVDRYEGAWEAQEATADA